MIQSILLTQLPLLLVMQISTSGASAPSAREVLKRASEARYVLPSDLSALHARFVVIDDVGELRGSIAWTQSEGLRVTIVGTGERAEDYRRRVESLIQHRLPNDFDQGDGKNNLTWTGNDNLIGKQIALNDAMNSMYRVNDNTILEVNRTLGNTKLIVNVLDTERLPNGKNLPKAMLVSYFDAISETLRRTETILDEYREQDGILIPVSRRVHISENGTLRTFKIAVLDVRLVRK